MGQCAVQEEVGEEIPHKPERLCSTFRGNSRCRQKRINGSCRGEAGVCRGYIVLTTSEGTLVGKTLGPISGAMHDPIFPYREAPANAMDVVC